MGEFVDEEQREAYIAGLRRELEYKRTAGKAFADVEAELARVSGEAPVKRARTATSTKAAAARRRAS